MSLTPNAIESSFVLDCIQAEELGSGMMFAAMFRDLLVFSHAAQEWFIWRGHYWERDCNGAALAAVDLVAQRVAEETIPIEARIEEHRESKNEFMRKAAEKERKKIVDYVRSLRRKTGRANCLVFAATLPEGQSLGIKGNEFDQDPWLFGCVNGVIDCRTARFRPGRPKDYITKVSPVAFDPKAQCPTFIEFLNSCHDNAEVIAFLRRWCGYMMTGSVAEQKYVVNIGAGRNGKGVFQEVVSDVFGPYSRSVKSEILLDQGRSKSASGPSPEIMTLYGARAIWASETNEGRRIDYSQVKLLTGADELNGRNPNDKYEICFKPTHKLNLSTNNAPSIDGDFAIRERQLTVVWEKQFVDEPTKPNQKLKIKGLAGKIKQELAGVLNWMLEGCVEWSALGGLNPPHCVLDATDEMASDTDTVQHFIDECCYVADHDPESVRTSAQTIYLAFADWFKKYHGNRVPGMKWFGGRMVKKFNRYKKGVYYYEGIGLLAE